MLQFNEAMVEGIVEEVTPRTVTISTMYDGVIEAKVAESVAMIVSQFIGRKVVAALVDKPETRSSRGSRTFRRIIVL